MVEIKKNLSQNYYDLWYDPEFVVLHTTLGSFRSSINHLKNPNSQVSAHFLISRYGEVSQLVDCKNGAWHAGNIKNPSDRAKNLLRKNLLGRYKNPNRYSIGIEFVSGYDIDRDGTLESWEELYTPKQIKVGVWLLTEVIEPELGKVFSDDQIITHKDIASYKQDIELQRQMFLSELAKVRKEGVSPISSSEVEKNDSTEKDTDELNIDSGSSIRVTNKGGKINIKKV